MRPPFAFSPIGLSSQNSEFRKPDLKLASLLLGIKKLKYVSRSDYIKSQKNL